MTEETKNGDAGRYRRPRQPVEVRRPKRWKQILVLGAKMILGLTALVLASGMGYLAYGFVTSTTVFRLPAVEDIEVVSNQHVSAAEVQACFAEDVGHAVFGVPLGERRQRIEEIPWVAAATVQRVYPNRLRVYLSERTPVAFLREGTAPRLIDRHGVVLPVPEDSSYSFPVLSGLSETMALPERAARMEIYMEFVQELDADGKSYTPEISEIDLSDPENVRAAVSAAGGVVYLLLGRDRYQEKFETYLQNRNLWQQGGEVVHAVDLRFRGQIVLNPEGGAGGGQ